jgi:hypothetical protein
VFGTVRKMKALVFKRYGMPDQITFADIPKPALKSDQILVQVQESACLDRIVEKASGQVRQDLDDFGLGVLASSEVFRRILQKFSPAGCHVFLYGAGDSHGYHFCCASDRAVSSRATFKSRPPRAAPLRANWE